MFRPATLVLPFLILPILLPSSTSATGVDDTTPPVIEAHGLVDVNASGFHGASVAYALPLATDDVDGAFPATCAPAPGSPFPIGDTEVACTASDAAGNVATPTSFVVRVTLRGVGSVGAEKASYAFSEAATEGIEGAYRLRTPDGNPLAGVEVTLTILRQLQFVGYVGSEQHRGTTDADGVFAFEPSTAFTLPAGHVLLATPHHPLLVGGGANGRYMVTVG